VSAEQFGWVSTVDDERRAFDELAEIVPERCMARDPKPVNQELLSKVEAIQQANGIESGFCFLYLWQAVFGTQPNWLAQLIGSCVGSSQMRVAAYRMAAEVFLLNDPETIFGTTIVGQDNVAPFAPYHYRAGRKFAGINGNSDGSTCGGQSKGAMAYGFLPCSTPGLQSDTFPEPQNTRLYKQWGANDTLLEQFASHGKKFVLMEASAVRNAADAKTQIVDGHKPASICSMWSFVPDYQHPTWKDEQGQPVWIWKRGIQPWAHAMSLIGYVVVNGKAFVIIENSWGNYHRGRKWFAIPAELFDTWCRSADCRTTGEIDMSDNPPAWPEVV
jgi:hypothetical protein